MEKSKATSYSFNPRTHIGCDLLKVIEHAQTVLFQSTHPHRVRQGSGGRSGAVERFQSTHPHRVRLYAAEFTGCVRVFQSTHPHRVRQVNHRKGGIRVKFQSTHPHRVRLTLIVEKCLKISFNPRTHIGCDSKLWRQLDALFEFQSTHPHRVRH